MAQKSQQDYIFEYFKKNPKREIEHAEVVDSVSKQYFEETGKNFRDPDRAIRKLHQSGFLIKVKKGVYKFDQDFIKERQLEDFTELQKKLILERDNFRCVICGKEKTEGVELHIDHIKPKDKGGKATIENGQTLCATHNFRKKNYKQTETGKKMFIRLYELAKSLGDKTTEEFCASILEVFEKNDVNGHIEWKR